MTQLSKLFLTREIISDCLDNSPLFRNAVIDLILERQGATPLEVELIDIMNTCYTTVVLGKITKDFNKITFIKALREFSTGRINEFIAAYPAIVDAAGYKKHPITQFQSDTLSLLDAKHLAEHIMEIRKPFTY